MRCVKLFTCTLPSCSGIRSGRALSLLGRMEVTDAHNICRRLNCALHCYVAVEVRALPLSLFVEDNPLLRHSAVKSC